VAKSLLKDAQVSAERICRSRFLTGAGHTTPTRSHDPGREKALSELSREELAAFIEKNQVDKIEGELGSRARDVPFLT